MFNQEFWENLECQLVVYIFLLEECTKEMNLFSENQSKSERQQYEDKLDRFIQLNRFYDINYVNFQY